MTTETTTTGCVAEPTSAMERREGGGARARFVTRQEFVRVLAAAAFPIYSWAIFQFLERMIGWLYYLTIGEVLSILAYTLVVAMAESVLVAGGLVVLAAVLPEVLLRRRFVVLGTTVVLAVMLAALGLHLLGYHKDVLRDMSPELMLALMVGFGLVLLAPYGLAQRSQRVRKALASFSERLLVLLYLYLTASIVGFVVVIVRNIL